MWRALARYRQQGVAGLLTDDRTGTTIFDRRGALGRQHLLSLLSDAPPCLLSDFQALAWLLELLGDRLQFVCGWVLEFFLDPDTWPDPAARPGRVSLRDAAEQARRGACAPACDPRSVSWQLPRRTLRRVPGVAVATRRRWRALRPAMSAAGFAEDFDWDKVPEPAMEAFSERLHLVETLLDPQIEPAAKRAERRRYCEQHGVGERTVRGYLHRYRKKGARALLFYRRRPASPRVHDPHLRAKIIALIDELPTRSVSQLRKLIAADHALHSALDRISDRTVYRFLAENGLTKSARYRMLADASRSSYRSFEAPHSMALLQADARDGIWLDTPQGRKKTYLFLWIDDFSRLILFGKYYFDEKLPAMLDSFRYGVLRYGIPLRVYLDYAEENEMPKSVDNLFPAKQIALQTSA